MLSGHRLSGAPLTAHPDPGAGRSGLPEWVRNGSLVEQGHRQAQSPDHHGMAGGDHSEREEGPREEPVHGGIGAALAAHGRRRRGSGRKHGTSQPDFGINRFLLEVRRVACWWEAPRQEWSWGSPVPPVPGKGVPALRVPGFRAPSCSKSWSDSKSTGDQRQILNQNLHGPEARPDCWAGSWERCHPYESASEQENRPGPTQKPVCGGTNAEGELRARAPSWKERVRRKLSVCERRLRMERLGQQPRSRVWEREIKTVLLR